MMFKTCKLDVETTTYREDLRTQENIRFVERKEFCELLISGQKLQRCDLPVARVRGVHDSAKNLRYFIEEERLFSN